MGRCIHFVPKGWKKVRCGNSWVIINPEEYNLINTDKGWVCQYCGTGNSPSQPIGLQNYQFMFHKTALDFFDLSHWDLSGVSSLEGMFSMSNKLSHVSLPSKGYEDVVSVDYMFFGCVNIEFIDLSCRDFSSLCSARNTFNYCTKLLYVSLRDCNLSALAHMEDFCTQAISLRELDFKNSNVKPTLVKNMIGLSNCRQLEKLRLL